MADKIHAGFIGLGLMGASMVKNLLRSGYSLTVFDIDRHKAAALKDLGAEEASCLKEVAEKSKLVLSSLPNPAAVKQVYLGPEGVLAGAASGTILVDMSTVDPETSQTICKAAVEKNVKYLDAPVSGGPGECETGKLTIMVGGDYEAFGQCRDIFDTLGSVVHYVGESGAGNIVKLVNNVMSHGNVLVAAEAFVLGVKAGVDARRLFEILSTSGGSSHHFKKRFPNALARNFEPGFKIDLVIKDYNLAFEMAKALSVPLPSTGLISQLYNAMSSIGQGDKDYVAIIKLFEEWAGVQVNG